MNTQIQQVQAAGDLLTTILGLSAAPVGVKFIYDDEMENQTDLFVNQHRYCQALMKARHGQKVLLDAKGIACPAAAAAFGFRPLPDGLKSGQGLVGFGIVSAPSVGKHMFEVMPHLEPGKLKRLYLFPLQHAEQVPDVVILEDEVEKLMWVNLAYLHLTGGERVMASTAVLQATCVDVTIIPYLENRLNFGLGCYGCREATDIGLNETVVGFPVALLAGIVEHVEFLGQKAIPNARAKKIYTAMEKRKDD
jgi:uncharacterized protein (DUF169 family)